MAYRIDGDGGESGLRQRRRHGRGPAPLAVAEAVPKNHHRISSGRLRRGWQKHVKIDLVYRPWQRDILPGRRPRNHLLVVQKVRRSQTIRNRSRRYPGSTDS